MEKFSSAVIVCDFSETQALFQAQWQQLFAQYHPYCLPIGNQPLILWALEALARLQCFDITLVDPYASTHPRLHQQLKSLAASIYGFQLHFTDTLPPEATKTGPVLTGVHLYYLHPDTQALAQTSLHNLRDYYEENMRAPTLWQSRVTLPHFYQQGRLGRGAHCQIHAQSICRHSLLGKYVSLQQEAQAIGSVIGDYSRLGPRTHLFGSLILPHTRLGSDLHLVGKIVSGQYLIDPLTGAWTEIDHVWCKAQKVYAL